MDNHLCKTNPWGNDTHCSCVGLGKPCHYCQRPVVAVLDIEANGLHGALCCFAAVFFADGQEIYTWTARVPLLEPVDEWTAENVFPVVTHMEYTHESIDGVYEEWRKLCEQWEPILVTHRPWPVEARFLWGAHQAIPFSGPFPILDTASMLIMAGRIPNCERFLTEENIVLPSGNPHDPLYDCHVTASTYFELMRQSQITASA